MQIDLTPEQQEFIDRAVSDGRLPSADAAVREALALWIERERERDEILAAIDEAETSLGEEGEITITKESMRELAKEVGRRGRARLAASRQSKR